MSARTELHRLVNELPDAEVFPARRFLEYLRDLHADPVLRALQNAPEDDEPVTDEDAAAAEEGMAAYRQGNFVAADEAKREFLG